MSDRRHIYETVTILNWETGEPELMAQVIKPEYRAKWMDLLTPEERQKYDALTDIEQLQVTLSGNPFRALGAEY